MVQKQPTKNKKRKKKRTMGMINLKTIISKRVVCEGLCHKQTESCSISLVTRMVEEAQKSSVNERSIVPGPGNHLGQTKLDWTGLAGTSTSMVKPILFISSMGGSIILHKQTRCTVRL